MHQREINLDIIVNWFFKVGISAQIIIYIRNLGIEFRLPFWLRSGILIWVLFSASSYQVIKICLQHLQNIKALPLLKFSRSAASTLFIIQSSNIYFLYHHFRRSLKHIYRRRGRWGKLHTAACVPPVSCSPPSHPPPVSHVCSLLWLHTSTPNTNPGICSFKQAPFTLNCTQSRMSRLNMPL